MFNTINLRDHLMRKHSYSDEVEQFDTPTDTETSCKPKQKKITLFTLKTKSQKAIRSRYCKNNLDNGLIKITKFKTFNVVVQKKCFVGFVKNVWVGFVGFNFRGELH